MKMPGLRSTDRSPFSLHERCSDLAKRDLSSKEWLRPWPYRHDDGNDHQRTSYDFTGAIWLGRGLINVEPQANAGKLDEGEIVGSKLVVAGCYSSALFDLVEEPLDQIAVFV